MKNKRNILASVTMLTLSTSAFAHPGHDHSHWLSDPIHILTALAIGAVVVPAVIVFKNKFKAKDK